MSFRIVEFMCFFVHLGEKSTANKIGRPVKVEPKNLLITTAGRVSFSDRISMKVVKHFTIELSETCRIGTFLTSNFLRPWLEIYI